MLTLLSFGAVLSRVTSTVAVDELFAGAGSPGYVAVAVLASAPAFLAVTTIVTVAEPPAGRVPSEHARVEVPEHWPWLAVADLNLAFAGSPSAIATSEAGLVVLRLVA